METELLSEYISPDTDAKILVLFGGNPNRRDEVVKLLMALKNLSIYGTLSEEEGMKRIAELKKVDMVLIGGRYSTEQRLRIRSFLKTDLPNTLTTEPGYDYPYDNDEILRVVKSKLQLTD